MSVRPPAVEDAERSVIGAVFLENDAIARVEKLQPSDFGDRMLGSVWRAMLDLHRRHEPIDKLLLRNELNGRATPGLMQTITECMSATPTAANIERYAEIVIEDGLARRTREALREIAVSEGSAEELLARMRGTLEALDGARTGRPVEVGIHWLSTADLFEPLPPTHWLFQELGICPGRASMVAGYGYSGKTIACQALLLATASGRPSWGHFPTGAPARVRHLDFEQGRHATLKRYQRLAIGLGIEPGELGDRLEVAIFPPAHLNAPEAADVYAKLSDGCALVLVDSLAGATPGELENESRIRTFVDMLSRVSEKTGATFLIIHHAGKPKDAHKDARTIVRGHSSIFDACGSVLVFAGEKSGPVLVQQVKAPAEAEGKAIAPFYLTIEDVQASEWTAAGVRIVHRPADDVADERRAEKEDRAEARAAAKISKVEAAIPEVAQRLWIELRKAAPRSITTRPDLAALVRAANDVKGSAITRLLAATESPRIRFVHGTEKGQGRGWYEAQ